MSDHLTAASDIQKTCVRYARALDKRDWALLDDVFDPGVTAQYGDQPAIHGRATLVAGIRKFLDNCGPSQHLLGNFDIDVSGDSARSACYVRVFHQGKGPRAHLTQESFGTYHASWRKTAQGWRVVDWRMDVSLQLGSWDAFGEMN
jgi:hypothetical protein